MISSKLFRVTHEFLNAFRKFIESLFFLIHSPLKNASLFFSKLVTAFCSLLKRKGFSFSVYWIDM